MKINLHKFNKQLEDCREKFDRLPSADLSKIPGWAAAGIAIAAMPPSLRRSIRAAIERKIELDQEAYEAKSAGMTAEEYRFYKFSPLPILHPDIKDIIDGRK